MASERLRYVGTCALLVLTCFGVSHVVLSGVSRWVEERGAYLWKGQEWMRLMNGSVFRGEGDGRVMLVASSEGREGFLSGVVEEALPGTDAYNGSISNFTLGTLLLTLDYIEKAYGERAIPDELLIGVTPWFLIDDPATEESFLLEALDLYSAYWTDPDVVPPEVFAKGPLSSATSRYRFLVRQSGRYTYALWGVARAGVVAVAPEADTVSALRRGITPAMYHHLPPLDQEGQLEELRAVSRPSADPAPRRDLVTTQFEALVAFAERHDMALYFANMPQSTWLVDDYFGPSYALYLDELARLTEGRPYLDLSRFLDDDEFYDLLHPDREGAERLSRRLGLFIAESRPAMGGAP